MALKENSNGRLPDPHSDAFASPPVGDWVHEIKQWYLTGSRRLAGDQRHVALGAAAMPAPTEGLAPPLPPAHPFDG